MDETEKEPTVTILPPEKESEKSARVRSGAESFRAEADLILQTNGKSIVTALAVEAQKGHIQSAKFLYDLADENCKLGAVEMVRRARSLALQWTTEPLWTGEPGDETVAVEVAGRKPEK
jgi:hypothetical protein